MLQTEFKAACILSAIIALLALVASAGGLFLKGLYRDNAWVTPQLQGGDLVTLVVAVPLLIASLIGSMRGSPRAQLIWIAMLGYMLYNYAFYLFAAAFNVFFLIYVALFSLPIFALISALARMDVDAIGRQFRAATPVKWISAYMLFFAFVLGGMWIAQTLGFVASGKVPQVILDSGQSTSIVFALDLSLLVPGLVLGAILLWQRRSWGYLLAAVMMIKATTYALALIAMGAFSASVSGSWEPLVVL